MDLCSTSQPPPWPYICPLHRKSSSDIIPWPRAMLRSMGKDLRYCRFPLQLMRLVQQSERMDEQAMLYTLEYLDVPWSSSIPWKPLGTSWNSAASTIPVALALFFWSKCDLDPMAPPSIYPSLTCLIGWVGIRLFLSCRMVLDFANIVV
jgi:hypothetical protein